MAVSSGQTEKISRQEDEKLSSHSQRLLIPTRTVLVFRPGRCGRFLLLVWLLLSLSQG